MLSGGSERAYLVLVQGQSEYAMDRRLDFFSFVLHLLTDFVDYTRVSSGFHGESCSSTHTLLRSRVASKGYRLSASKIIDYKHLCFRLLSLGPQTRIGFLLGGVGYCT
jgi:hypothetical protein